MSQQVPEREKTHRIEHSGGFTLRGAGSVFGTGSGGGDAGGGDGECASYISGESGKTGKRKPAS